MPIVSPASDAHFCRKMHLYEWWEKCRRVRKEGVIAFKELRRTLCRRYTVPPTGTQKQPYERNAPYFFIFAHHPVCKHSVCMRI